MNLARAAATAGCLFQGQTERILDGRPVTVGAFLCPDSSDGDAWAGPRLLEALSEGDQSSELATLAYHLTAGHPEPGRVLHRYVQRRVRFTPEIGEVFQSPAYTHRARFGDCDDSQRLLKCLASLAGLEARYVYFVKGADPSHVTVQIKDKAGRWQWAEVTVPAQWGEHPLAALARLGIPRPDIDGKGVIMPKWGDDEKEGLSLETAGAKLGQVSPGDFNLVVPSYIDGGDGTQFVAALIAAVSGIADPVDALALMLHESGLEPFADNGAAVGIFQLDPYDSSFTGMSRDAWKALTAADQVPFAGRFWAHMARAFGVQTPILGRDLYWLNFLPATVIQSADDSHVIADSTDTIFLANGRSEVLPGAYTANTGLDHGGKGFITAGDMALALQDGANAHPKLFPYLSAVIQEQVGSSSPLVGGGGSHFPGGTSRSPILASVATLIGVGLVGGAAYLIWG